jgi:hypothetical protein
MMECAYDDLGRALAVHVAVLLVGRVVAHHEHSRAEPHIMLTCLRPVNNNNHPHTHDNTAHAQCECITQKMHAQRQRQERRYPEPRWDAFKGILAGQIAHDHESSDGIPMFEVD